MHANDAREGGKADYFSRFLNLGNTVARWERAKAQLACISCDAKWVEEEEEDDDTKVEQMKVE